MPHMDMKTLRLRFFLAHDDGFVCARLWAAKVKYLPSQAATHRFNAHKTAKYAGFET